MFKKLALLVLFVAFVSAPAMAGNIPEFDACGNDSANYFNDFVKQLVIDNNIDSLGNNINENSDFSAAPYIYRDARPWEFFATNGSGPGFSPCFVKEVGGVAVKYIDYLMGARFPGYFEWRIVLQMAPETDLDLNIRDCVLKQNQTNIWRYAQQTGRFRQSNERLVFSKAKNPRVTVVAYPGIRQAPQTRPFNLDARTMPQLNRRCLDNQLYTSKALWEEGIVMALPEPGQANRCGQRPFQLREGDLIHVRFDIPFSNPTDIYYGKDNVVIKYVGIIGFDLTTLDPLP